MTVNGSINRSSVDTSASNSSLYSSILLPWDILAGVVIVVCCLFGIPANIAVIVKLSRHLRGSSISQRLFFHLALSDLFCLLCLLVGMVIFYNGVHLIDGACRFIFYLFVFCINSSLNIRVMISIQRYHQVLQPQKWEKVDRTWQRVLLSSVWILGGLMALPVVFFLTAKYKDGNPTDVYSCKNQRIEPILEMIYIVFVVCSHLVLLSCYVLLVRGVHRTQMSNKKKPRVTNLFIRIILVSLVAGFLPLSLRLLYVTARLRDHGELLRISRMLMFMECFYFTIHCMNPFLYFFASRHQRQDRSTTKKRLLMPLNDSS